MEKTTPPYSPDHRVDTDEVCTVVQSDDVLNDISSREWVEHFIFNTWVIDQSSSSELIFLLYFFYEIISKKTYKIERALSSINEFTSSKGMQNNNDLRKKFEQWVRFQYEKYVPTNRYLSSAHKPFESIPGLSSLPVIGPLHHFIPGIGSVGIRTSFFELSKVLYEKYGSIVKMEVFSRAKFVILYEPDDFDKIYRSEDLVAPSRPGFDTLVYYRTVMRKSTYDGVYGLTTAQDMQWRDFRTKVNPAMLKPKLVKLYTPVLEEIADDMVARLQRLKDDVYLKENIDVELTKWALESIAYIGLGSRIGCLEDNLPDDHPARVLTKCAKDIVDLSWKLEFLPSLWRYYPTSNFKKIVRTFDLQWDTSLKFIEEAKQRINARTHEVPEEDKSILEKLLAIDDKVATTMANEMLFAGIDTVSFTTVGLLYHLATNPKVQEKLREEIRSSEPNKRYLKACLKESLRLFPVIPANLRRSTKDHYVAGYHIPVGVDVIAPNEFLSRMDKYYPRATEFIPERWLVEKSHPLYYGNCHSMVTLPFGFGVRSCIGRRIAELEIEVFIKRFLQEFEVTWEGPPIEVVSRVINSFKKPYYFKFQSAN